MVRGRVRLQIPKVSSKSPKVGTRPSVSSSSRVAELRLERGLLGGERATVSGGTQLIALTHAQRVLVARRAWLRTRYLRLRNRFVLWVPVLVLCSGVMSESCETTRLARHPPGCLIVLCCKGNHGDGLARRVEAVEAVMANALLVYGACSDGSPVAGGDRGLGRASGAGSPPATDLAHRDIVTLND